MTLLMVPLRLKVGPTLFGAGSGGRPPSDELACVFGARCLALRAVTETGMKGRP